MHKTTENVRIGKIELLMSPVDEQCKSVALVFSVLLEHSYPRNGTLNGDK